MTRIATPAFAAAFIASVAVGIGGAWAQQPALEVAVRTTDLGHQTYMLEGMGGNVTVAVAHDGVIMIDGQFANMHDKLKAAIAAITKQPVKYLVNTHLHGDHTGGNAGFAKDGATVVAQANVGKRLAAGTVNGLTGAKTAPAAPEGIPTCPSSEHLAQIGGQLSRASASSWVDIKRLVSGAASVGV